MCYTLTEVNDLYHLVFNGKTLKDISSFLGSIQAVTERVAYNGGYLISPTDYSTFLYRLLKNNGYSSMKLLPYDYQQEAIGFALTRSSALLRMCCGAGKTTVVIGCFVEALRLGMINGPGLIVVKASLKHQWLSEIKKFSYLDARIIQTKSALCGSELKKIERLLKKESLDEKQQAKLDSISLEIEQKFLAQFESTDLYVLNYETLNDDEVRNHLIGKRPEFVAADEIHYIKNADAKRSQSLYEFNDALIKIGATATPIQKDYMDVYGIFNFLKPELFKSKAAFEQQFVSYSHYNFGKKKFKNINILVNKITPYMFIKTEEDIASQLPELMPPIQRWCTLDSKVEERCLEILQELETCKDQEKQLLATFSNKEDYYTSEKRLQLEARILMLQTFSQELANAPELLDMSDSFVAKEYGIKGHYENHKLELLMNQVGAILDSGEKVIIFSKYERMQDIFANRILKDYKIEIARAHGGVKGEDRFEQVYTQFKDNPDCKVLLLSNACAEGINAGHCKYLIEYDLADSYAIQTQRHGRIRRADSTHKKLFVYQILARNTFDEIALKIVQKKERYDQELKI